jgi:hypothetical protein
MRTGTSILLSPAPSFTEMMSHQFHFPVLSSPYKGALISTGARPLSSSATGSVTPRSSSGLFSGVVHPMHPPPRRSECGFEDSRDLFERVPAAERFLKRVQLELLPMDEVEVTQPASVSGGDVAANDEMLLQLGCDGGEEDRDNEDQVRKRRRMDDI